MKKILFDVYELAPGTGKSMGVYNYARHLLSAMAASPRRDFEVIVACNPAALADFSPPDPLRRIKHFVRGQRPPSLAERLVWIFGAAALSCRKLDVKLYFSPRGFLPFGIKILCDDIKTVATVHDLIRFWYKEKFPGYFNLVEDWFICKSLSRSVRSTDRVISISNWSAADMSARTGRIRDVTVVYNGLIVSDKKKSGVAKDRFFAIGSALPHKNTAFLIKAYIEYRKRSRRPTPLTICGIADPNVPGIDAVRGLTDDELNYHYASAKAFLFTSLIEGFGFPPLEAMAHGTAVICSDIEVLREVTRGEAIYVSPLDVNTIVAELLRFDDIDAREADGPASEKRRDIARSYTWEETASQTLDVILR